MAKGNGGGPAVIDALIQAQAELVEALGELAAATRLTTAKVVKAEKIAARMARTLNAVGRLSALERH